MNVFSRSRGALECLCRHPSKHHRSNHAPGKHNPTKKKRDISTSFRKGCIPRPLVNTTHTSHEEEDDPILGIPPPAAAPSAAGSTPSQPPALQAAQVSTGLSLGEPCRTSRASTAEPVIAAAALAAPLVLTAQDLGLSLQDDPATGSPSSSSSDEDSADGLWAEDPLASFDRVLDGLLVAPTLPQAFTPASPPSRPAASSPSSSLTLSSLLEALPVVSTPASAAPAPASQQGRAGVQEAAPSTSSSSSGAKKKSSSSSKGASSKALRQKASVPCAAAAAAPAVTVIHSEAEYERELQAAAALQQLLVVKVESSHHLLQGALDPSLRFQTHTNLPTPLNTYLPHNDLGHSDFGPGSAPFGFLGGAGGGSGAAGSSPSGSSTAEVLASMGIPLGPIPASNGSHSHGMGGLGGMAPSSSLFGAGSSSSGEPFSPVHAWYKQLAAQYAHSAAAEGRTSPVRFLSLQSDQGAARAVARRLGVSSPLAVVLVDPASGRKLQEVCGAKIEQELPNGLLYFAGSDAQGARPTEQLAQVNTQADFEAIRSASPLAVMAFHIHAAPPCVRSYARMHGMAQQYAGAAAAPRVSFGVMDVDAAAEGAAVSSILGVGQFPTYVIFRDGQEVARLSSSPDRRKLGEVLAQHAAEAAAGKE